jgi:hypothetical protein
MGTDEALEKGGQQRQELLVELLELAAADGLEESAEERKVVGGLGGVGGVAHGLHDDGGEVRAEEGLVLGEEGDRAKDELEEAEEDGGLWLLWRALPRARDSNAGVSGGAALQWQRPQHSLDPAARGPISMWRWRTSASMRSTRKESRMSAKERDTVELARKCWSIVDMVLFWSTRA